MYNYSNDHELTQICTMSFAIALIVEKLAVYRHRRIMKHNVVTQCYLFLVVI